MSETLGANYSRLDRMLHSLAFSSLEVQKSLADIEDRMHAKRLETIAIEMPVFITGLPRAGTTLLLDVLAKDSGFVAHTYRCMPFVLCPILWDQISRGFRRPGEKKERAHGDGMSVSYDSPEAFEEVLWMAFWPGKYRSTGIDLWGATDRQPEFEQFLKGHIRKLIAVSAPPKAKRPRYISKNNANIARIPLLRQIFPDAIFIVPFRDPVNQAASLMRQHARFVKVHAEDRFTRRYMDDIGHFEFGSGLRPIGFPDVAGVPHPADPMAADFWLACWIRAYADLAANRSDGLNFIDFDRFCDQPAQSLGRLAKLTGYDGSAETLNAQASEFHAAVRYDPAKLGFDPALLKHAQALHRELTAHAGVEP